MVVKCGGVPICQLVGRAQPGIVGGEAARFTVGKPDFHAGKQAGGIGWEGSWLVFSDERQKVRADFQQPSELIELAAVTPVVTGAKLHPVELDSAPVIARGPKAGALDGFACGQSEAVAKVAFRGGGGLGRGAFRGTKPGTSTQAKRPFLLANPPLPGRLRKIPGGLFAKTLASAHPLGGLGMTRLGSR